MAEQQTYGNYMPHGAPGAVGIYPGQVGAFNEYGRDVPFNPALQRTQGLSEGFGGQYAGALASQQGVFNQFGQMAAGQGPSLAQSQLQQGMGQASQAATQQMLNARGGNAAGAQAAAAQIGSSMGGQAAMAAAQLRQQEQLAAMQAQAGMANQMAAQGLQGQIGMEGFNQAALQAQLEANMGKRQMQYDEKGNRIERARGIKGMILPDLSDERAKTNILPTQNRPNEQTGAQKAGGILGSLGGIGSLIGPLVALSDEEAKQDIRPGNLSASQAVGAMNPYSWEYKSGYGPAGRQLGPMAQEVEQVYPGAVQTIGGLKHVDVGRMTGLNTAALSEQIRMNDERDQKIAGLEAMLASVAGPGGAASQDSFSLGGVTGGVGPITSRGYDPRFNTYQGYGGNG